MRTRVAGKSLGLLLVPTFVVLALACNDSDSTPVEPPRVTGPVTPPAAQGSYDLMLASATISAPQGWADRRFGPYARSTTLNLARRNFTGNVTLIVENLPTGVSANFYRESYNSWQLWMGVSSNTPTGTFHVLVRGVVSGLADRTAPLTLTITETPFTVTLSSPALTIVRGTATTTTVNVLRNNFTDPVMLTADMDRDGNMPPGVSAALDPNPVTGNSAVLTVTVSDSVVPGVYYVRVWGHSWSVYNDALLTLTVTAPAGSTSR